MSTRILPAWVAAALLAAPALGWGHDCRHTAERRADLDAAGAVEVRIEARAGSLTVNGRPGASTIAVRGTACASRERDLDEIRLDTRRRGDEVVIEAEMPDSGSWRGGAARLDLEIEVPAELAVRIEDGSGSILVRNLASVDIADGSGGIEIDTVAGSVTIRDGSGEIEARGVGGRVEIADGSGSIYLEEIGGDVELRDGSGSIEVRGVRGSVVVRADGSGSIRVSRVDGDFRVDADGSGGISYDRVAGRVSVP